MHKELVGLLNSQKPDVTKIYDLIIKGRKLHYLHHLKIFYGQEYGPTGLFEVNSSGKNIWHALLNNKKIFQVMFAPIMQNADKILARELPSVQASKKLFADMLSEYDKYGKRPVDIIKEDPILAENTGKIMLALKGQIPELGEAFRVIFNWQDNYVDIMASSKDSGLLSPISKLMLVPNLLQDLALDEQQVELIFSLGRAEHKNLDVAFKSKIVEILADKLWMAGQYRFDLTDFISGDASENQNIRGKLFALTNGEVYIESEIKHSCESGEGKQEQVDEKAKLFAFKFGAVIKCLRENKKILKKFKKAEYFTGDDILDLHLILAVNYKKPKLITPLLQKHFGDDYSFDSIVEGYLLSLDVKDLLISNDAGMNSLALACRVGYKKIALSIGKLMIDNELLTEGALLANLIKYGDYEQISKFGSLENCNVAELIICCIKNYNIKALEYFITQASADDFNTTFDKRGRPDVEDESKKTYNALNFNLRVVYSLFKETLKEKNDRLDPEKVTVKLNSAIKMLKMLSMQKNLLHLKPSTEVLEVSSNLMHKVQGVMEVLTESVSNEELAKKIKPSLIKNLEMMAEPLKCVMKNLVEFFDDYLTTEQKKWFWSDIDLQSVISGRTYVTHLDGISIGSAKFSSMHGSVSNLPENQDQYDEPMGVTENLQADFGSI